MVASNFSPVGAFVSMRVNERPHKFFMRSTSVTCMLVNSGVYCVRVLVFEALCACVHVGCVCVCVPQPPAATPRPLVGEDIRW